MRVRGKRPKENQFFLPSFGAHLPGVPADVGSKLIIYPLPRFRESGFDLDCTPMLVSNGLVLDKLLRDYLDSERPPYLEPMRITIDQLAEAGLVTFEDYAACGREFRPDLEACIEDHLEYPLLWLGPLRRAVATHMPLIEKQIQHMAPYVDADVERTPYSVLAYRAIYGSSEASDKRIHGYLNSRRRNFSKFEENEIRDLVRPMVAQAAFNQHLAKYLGVPFLDWEDVDPFHRLLTAEGRTRRGNPMLTREQLRATRQLFSTSLNALVPQDNKRLIKFLKSDRSVLSLRQAIADRLATGAPLDQRWVSEVGFAAEKAELAHQRRQRLFRWLLAPLGFAGPVGEAASASVEAVREAGGVLGEFVEQGAETGVEEGAAVGGQKRRRDFMWYYTLVDNFEQSD